MFLIIVLWPIAPSPDPLADILNKPSNKTETKDAKDTKAMQDAKEN